MCPCSVDEREFQYCCWKSVSVSSVCANLDGYILKILELIYAIYLIEMSVFTSNLKFVLTVLVHFNQCISDFFEQNDLL